MEISGYLTATAFPASGPLSLSGAGYPALGGMSPVTQVTQLLDTRWASSAADQAAGSAAACCQSCAVLVASGAPAVAGSALPFASDPLLASSALSGGNSGFFDLGQASSLMGATSRALGSAAQGLGIACALQSIAGGAAEIHANALSASSQLVSAACAPGVAPEVASSYLRLSIGVLASASGASPLVVGVAALASQGALGCGDPSIGRVLSGQVGYAQSLDPSSSILGAVPAPLVALTPGDSALASSVEAVPGLGACVLPPSASSAADWAASYPPGPVSGLPLPQTVAGAVVGLAATLTGAVQSLIANAERDAILAAQAAEEAAGAVAGAAARELALLTGQTGRPSPGTAPRQQGLPVVDGYPPGGAPGAAAAAAPSAQASLAPSVYPPGSLGRSGLFSPGPAAPALGAGFSLSATRAITAFQAAAYGAAGDVADAEQAAAGGLLALATPAEALLSAAVAAACALARAAAAALSYVASLIESALAPLAEALAAALALAAEMAEMAAQLLEAADEAFLAAEMAAERLLALLGALAAMGVGAGLAAQCSLGPGMPGLGLAAGASL